MAENYLHCFPIISMAWVKGVELRQYYGSPALTLIWGIRNFRTITLWKAD